MWVLTEEGELVNLDKVVDICPLPERPWPDGTEPYNVVAFEPGMRLDDKDDPLNGYSERHYLCSCDDEEHGKRIIVDLAEYMAHSGVRVIDIRQVKERGTDPLYGIAPDDRAKGGAGA